MVAAAATMRRPSSLARWFCGLTPNSAAAAGTNRPAAEASSAILASAARQLSQARDVLVAKEATLQQKISQEMERAKVFIRSGNRQAALQCLNRRKYYESQMNQVGRLQLSIDTKEKIIAHHMGINS